MLRVRTLYQLRKGCGRKLSRNPISSSFTRPYPSALPASATISTTTAGPLLMARFPSTASTITIDGVRGRAMQHQVAAGAGGLKNVHGAPRADGKLATPEPEKKEKPEEKEGFFWRHGGKLVWGFLGWFTLWALRNHLGGNALDALKEEAEEACPIAPEEVEELRCVNDFPPETFRKILNSAQQAFPSGRATYPDFARHVTSSGLLPEPLFLGYLLDRVVLAAAAHPGFLGAVARGEVFQQKGMWDDGSGLREHVDGDGDGRALELLELDLGFLMVVFSAAVNTTPKERVQQLWELARDRAGLEGELELGAAASRLRGEGRSMRDDVLEDDDGDHEGPPIPAWAAIEIVGMLMASRQLPVERYAAKDEKRAWPVQQYRPATGRDAFLNGLADLHEEEEKRSKGWIERKLAPKYDPVEEERVTLELFEKVLRSKPVCAWGECLGGRIYRA